MLAVFTHVASVSHSGLRHGDAEFGRGKNQARPEHLRNVAPQARHHNPARFELPL